MKTNNLYLLASMLILSYNSIFCDAQIQQKIDSVISLLPSIHENKKKADAINLLSFLYKDIHAETGLKYANEALAIVKNTDYKDGISQSYRNIGLNYFFLGNYFKALENYLIALKIAQQIPSNKASFLILSDIAILYSNQGNYLQSLEYYLTALDLAENKLNSPYQISLSANNIGILYYRLKDYPIAEKYFLKVLKNKKTNAFNSNETLMNLGNVYREQKDYAKADFFYKKAASQFEVNEDLTGQTELNLNLGFNNYESGKYQMAEEEFLKALNLSEHTQNKLLRAKSLFALGDLYRQYAEDTFRTNRKKFLGRSILKLKEALIYYQELKSWDSYQQTAKALSQTYQLKGDYKNALHYSNEHSNYKDSVFNEEKTKELTRLEMNYEFAKRQDSVKLKVAIQEKDLQIQKRQFWILGIGFVLLLFLGILLYLQTRLTKKKNKELEEANRTKTRFFNILSHDLRSPVSELVRFLYLKKDNPELLDNETIERLDNHTIQSAENLLISMEDLLLWSKGQMENFRPEFKNISAKEIFEEIEKEFRGNERISFFFEFPENIWLYTDKNYLKTIIRNLTSNAVKVLQNIPDAKIIWKGEIKDGKVIMTITDNGFGGTHEQFLALYDEKHVVGIKTGLGLHLVRDMAKAIDCKVEVKSETGNGTTIKLCIQMKK